MANKINKITSIILFIISIIYIFLQIDFLPDSITFFGQIDDILFFIITFLNLLQNVFIENEKKKKIIRYIKYAFIIIAIIYIFYLIIIIIYISKKQ